MDSISTSIGILSILLFNVVCSLFVRGINKKWIKLKRNRASLLDDYGIARSRINQKKGRSWLEAFCLHLVYATYYLVDFPTNVVRFCLTKNKIYTGLVDALVVVFTILSIATSFWKHGACDPYLTGYFFWRVVVVISGKVQSLTEVKEDFTKRGVASFNRMVFILFLNILELTACYTVFYTFFGMVDPDVKYMESFRIVFGVFITEGLPERLHILCWPQNVLVISQFFIIVVFFLMFTANLVSLKYRDDIEKLQEKEV